MRMNTHALAKCAGCWNNTGLTATGRAFPIPVRQAIRHASTTTRSKAKSDTGAGEVAAVPKKKISTKTATTATATKRPRKKAETTAPSTAEEAPEPVKKTTRAASTKSTAASVKKKAESASTTVKAAATKAKASASTAASTAKKAASASATTRKTSAASKAASAKSTEPVVPVDSERRTFENAADPAKWSQRFEEKAATMKPVDRNSPEYKKAGRSWLGLMVGLPFFIVTSYILFERLALGKQPPPRPQPNEVVEVEKESVA